MRKLLVILLLLPVLAWAQESFNGTWRIDPASADFGEKPEIYVLHNGTFTCKTCVPVYSVKADGTDQKVAGSPYMDTASVKVIDEKNVERVFKKDGKERASERDTVSEDGKLLTVNFRDTSASNGKVVTGIFTLTRLAEGPQGSHAISGSWKPGKVADVSEEGLMFTLKVSGDTVSYSSPTGQSYTAKLDGPAVPLEGEPGNIMVSLKKLGPNSIEETDTRDGKVISVSKWMVEGDTLKFDVENKEHGSSAHFVAKKL